MKIKIKIQTKSTDSIIPRPFITSKGDWIDLRSSETVELKGPITIKEKGIPPKVLFYNYMIPLGISVKLPSGMEAALLPRSSTYLNHRVIAWNSEGVIDNSYNGDSDEWKFPVIAMSDGKIYEGDRVAQFRIQLSQKATFLQKLKWLFSNKITIEYVDSLEKDNRGGFGSTGIK